MSFQPRDFCVNVVNGKPSNQDPGKRYIDINHTTYALHPNSDKWDESKTYTGVVIYGRLWKGVALKPITKVILKEYGAVQAARDGRTMHAAAYKLAYYKFPDEEPDNSLVVSGFSIKSDGRVECNSYSFNSDDKRQKYMNHDYYLNTDRKMGVTEESVITNFVENKWKKSK